MWNFLVFLCPERPFKSYILIRSLGIISLICILIVQSASTSLTLINFELQRETIIQLFCINKEAPEKQCSGKCYLEKQIEADKDSQSDAPQTRANFLSLIFTIETLPTTLITPFTTPIKHRYSYIIPHFASKEIPIFHPPKY